MLDIDGEALRQHIELVAEQTQMRDPLHLVLSVVHEPLVEARRLLRQLHEHVGLLNVVQHARHLRHVRVRRKRHPLVEVVTLRWSGEHEATWVFELSRKRRQRPLSIHGCTSAFTFGRSSLYLRGRRKRILLLDAAGEGVAGNALRQLVLEGGDDRDHIIATQERTRKIDKGIVQIICVLGWEIGCTGRPHIHIGQPQMRRLHMAQGDVTQHVNGVRFRTVREVSDDRESARNDDVTNHLLIDLGAFTVEEKCNAERSSRDTRKRGVPIPTLQPKGQKVHSFITTHHRSRKRVPRLRHDCEIELLLAFFGTRCLGSHLRRGQFGSRGRIHVLRKMGQSETFEGKSDETSKKNEEENNRGIHDYQTTHSSVVIR